MNAEKVHEYLERWEGCREVAECDIDTCGDFIECSEAILFILHDSELLELLESE